jgi:tRNA(Ile)-lysidine synthase
MTELPQIARATCERHNLLVAGTPLLLMVSGGGDSVALLRLAAAGELGTGLSASVLHVNHLLRGDESDADQEFVEGLCADLGVACRSVRYDVGAYAAESGLNLEDAGRRVRYRFAEEELDALCDAAGVPRTLGRIATAHTLDDRVETFLMRALAGSGATGLASIAPVRGRIVRPLLDATRAQVRGWLEACGAAWREDATNDDTARLRARIRAELLPVLESYNPRVRDAIARTTDVLAEEDALLGEMAEQFARDFARVTEGCEVRFERAAVLTLSRAMRRRVVRHALVSAFPEASRIELAHLDAICDGMASETFARDLPDGLRARSEYATLVVSRDGGERATVAPSLLELPGTADLGPAGRIVAEEVAPTDATCPRDAAVIDATGVSGPLSVDGVREGDRMRPLGMEGSRKLSDMLTDAKIPRNARGAVPVVRDGERIVWLAGVRMSDEYRVSEATSRAVRLTWQRPTPEET